MLPLTFILLAAAALDRVDEERAATRIQQAQYCAAVEQRAQHREVERIQPMATADVGRLSRYRFGAPPRASNICSPARLAMSHPVVFSGLNLMRAH